MGKDKRDLFALDIGTRNVVGIVYEAIKEGIKIRSFTKRDHQVRSMFDGQIHDINEVSEVVKDIKEDLEKRMNINLEQVAVAAAGRSLRTKKVHVEKERDGNKRISFDEVSTLELDGVQKAWRSLENDTIEDEDSEYHCVGHSVVKYFLDGHPILNLQNQRGSKVGAEIIATFLPQVVIDGLEGVMEEVGLKISSLTLEPIAAINLAIPREIRMLNLALIDIGAGTSDIAITSGGTIIAYKMVPLAGDEITEKICQELLVDFNTAEKIKLSSNKTKAEVSYKDVLGNNRKIKKSELMELITPPIEKITTSLAKAIKEINGTSPSAVFCIGGGSQLPTLDSKLASALDLSEERVTIKGEENWDKIKNLRKGLKGPQGVTPLGIALSSCAENDFGFFYVTVNGKLIRLFGRENLKVSDALMAAGYKMDSLLVRSGKGLKIKLNGEERYFPGNPGSPPVIKVNGEDGGLETFIKNNDEINIEEGKIGAPRRLKAKDLFLEVESKYFYLNGRKVSYPFEVFVNGEKVLPEKQIFDGNYVEIKLVNDVEGICRYLEVDLNDFDLWLNDKKLSKEDIVPEKAEIMTQGKNVKESVKDIENNLEKLTTNDIDSKNFSNNTLKVEVNGDMLEITKNKDPKFLDIFNYVDFDTSRKKGDLIIKVNGEAAEFTSPIQDGDSLELYWSEEGKKKLERRV